MKNEKERELEKKEIKFWIQPYTSKKYKTKIYVYITLKRPNNKAKIIFRSFDE